MLQKPVSLEANLNIYQFLIVASPAFWVAGGVGACGITPWISWQFILHTHNHSNRQFRVPNWPNVHVFGPWEEVGEARATMLTHGEHARRKTAGTKPSCCEIHLFFRKCFPFSGARYRETLS